ncbi:hypothetical protein KFL_008000030 [Klebsormidium nitens]|uniref:Elongator complex protein 2 n=1 Tax=Klebsormidium nitens TaxID=105231 RepID=A0A1Y1IN36_KLENI|nr:hypothetical protein KFL_008000030 [Klebsormidium nitens]|eukprot:GAQ91522.1 hypothetical protein KFL_008000030 [Klebsormidium nitens]
MDVRLEHVGVGCNRVVNAASWGPSGLVAFGAHNAVALYSPEDVRVLTTLPGHSDRVNCTEWLPRHSAGLPTNHANHPVNPPGNHPANPAPSPLPLILASGDASGTIFLWGQQSTSRQDQPRDTSEPNFVSVAHIPTAHSGAVTCLVSHVRTVTPSVHPARIIEALLVSTSSDGTVKIWGISKGGGSGQGLVETTCVQTISVGPKVMMSAAMTALSERGSRLLLALGGLDNAVHLYTSSEHLQFSKVCSLTGHQDWVRSLAFAPRPNPSASNPPPLLLASGSQDRNVRIWRIAPRKSTSTSVLTTSTEQEPIPSTSSTGNGESNLLSPSTEEGNLALGSRVSKQANPAKPEINRSNSDPKDEAPDLAGFMSLLHMYAAGPVFRVGGRVWEASLESLLIGHEDWVHSVRWAPPPVASVLPSGTSGGASPSSNATGSNGLIQNGDASSLERSAEAAERRVRESAARSSLLSASMDRTMMVWRPDARTGLWTSEVTVGELGVSNLGFYTGLWSPRGDAILAHGYTGSFHLWGREVLESGGEEWRPRLAVSGHVGAVSDCEWDRGGRYLLSVSQDQTARIQACWQWGGRDAGSKSEEKGKKTPESDAAGGKETPVSLGGRRAGGRASWHEIARPQVHGHDIHCCAFAGPAADVSTSTADVGVYVSGSEEKVARVFQAPEAFLQTLSQGAGLEDPPSGALGAGAESSAKGSTTEKILGANMSALGLSQKPIYAAGGANNGDKNGGEMGGLGGEAFDTVPEAAPKVLEEPPLEEHLAQNTLWPEVRKLYGHGNELWCMAGDHSGRILATASKAQSAAAAAIWLWDTATWQPVGQLSAHQLTVTQLEFSGDDRFLLAVSRDRHVSLWERTGSGSVGSAAGTGQNGVEPGSKDPPGKSDGNPVRKRDEESVPSTSSVETSSRGAIQELIQELADGVGRNERDDKEEEGLGSWIKEGSYLDRRTVVPSSETGPPYRLVFKVEAHKRIVWAGTWAPDGRTFATGSRDKLVKIWAVSYGADGRATGVREVTRLPAFRESVTALAWGARNVLAVGLENGGLELWQGEPGGLSLTRRFDAGLCHVAAVHRIRWKSGYADRWAGDSRQAEASQSERLQLAACGADHSVRIFSIDLR